MGEIFISLKVIQPLNSTGLKVICTTRLIERNMWDKILLNISFCSYNVSFGHLKTLSHSIFSRLKLQPEKIPVHLLVLCLCLLGASTSAPECPRRLTAAQRPPFAPRFPAKWVCTQTCFASRRPGRSAS